METVIIVNHDPHSMEVEMIKANMVKAGMKVIIVGSDEVHKYTDFPRALSKEEIIQDLLRFEIVPQGKKRIFGKTQKSLWRVNEKSKQKADCRRQKATAVRR